MHVPSHVGIVGNINVDTIADMGRRRSPLRAGFVTTTRYSVITHLEEEQASESDMEEAPLGQKSQQGDTRSTLCTPAPVPPYRWLTSAPPPPPPPPAHHTTRSTGGSPPP